MLALISGGGSALLVQPAGAITLAEKQAVNDALLASGAPIGEMNIVRKHLSRVKGGQLAAAAWPARMLALMISDIPGDDPALIASGPTVGDASTPADARAILARWRIAGPGVGRGGARGSERGACARTTPRLARTENRVIAAPSQSLAAAAALAEAAGCDVRILGDALEGEAREVAAAQARLAREVSVGRCRRPVVLLLSGGECTVTRRGDGVGGPERRVLPRARPRPRRRAGDPRPRLRHRRRRRRGRGRGRDRRRPTPSRGPGRRARSGRRAGAQRRPRLLRGAGRSGRHRADPDQRQRLPRDPRRAGIGRVLRGLGRPRRRLRESIRSGKRR